MATEWTIDSEEAGSPTYTASFSTGYQTYHVDVYQTRTLGASSRVAWFVDCEALRLGHVLTRASTLEEAQRAALDSVLLEIKNRQDELNTLKGLINEAINA